MENRNYYSLHCLQMETQLIHANLDILYDILGDMTKIQAKAHREVGGLINFTNKVHSTLAFISLEIKHLSEIHVFKVKWTNIPCKNKNEMLYRKGHYNHIVCSQNETRRTFFFFISARKSLGWYSANHRQSTGAPPWFSGQAVPCGITHQQ